MGKDTEHGRLVEGEHMDSLDTKGTARLVKGNVVYLVDEVEDNSLGGTTY